MKINLNSEISGPNQTVCTRIKRRLLHNVANNTVHSLSINFGAYTMSYNVIQKTEINNVLYHIKLRHMDNMVVT